MHSRTRKDLRPATPGRPAAAPIVNPARVRSGAAAPNPDAPVRVEVEMPRGLYERLTEHDDAPRSRYDAALGRAEFVAEPGIAHERRTADITGFFALLGVELVKAGRGAGFLSVAATRLLSDEGAFEPDASLFVDLAPADLEALMKLEGYLDGRAGGPVPDLVVEIDRGVDSSHKLAPYFRMGVREAWTWSRRHGARMWVGDPESPRGFRAAKRSRALPGLTRDELDRLLASPSPTETSRRSLRLADRIAKTLLAARC